MNQSDLSAEIRKKVFSSINEDLDFLVTVDPANKGYLSGYHSMSHDLAPHYLSAAIAQLETVRLVLGAADAGPAADTAIESLKLFRYGEFYFESRGDEDALDLGPPSVASFEEAFRAAVQDCPSPRGKIGVDGPDGSMLWELCSSIFGSERLVDISPRLKACRATKLPEEVARIRRATQLVEEGIEEISRQIRPGMSEIELAALVSNCMARGGGVPRFVSVTSGPRSALADAYPTLRTIQKGEMVRVDAGCTYLGYWSDMARTLVVGEPPEAQRKAYQALHHGLDVELAEVKAGVSASHLFRVAVDAVKEAGIAGYRRQHCGHGIGLNMYEMPFVAPRDDTRLASGMVLSVETPYYQLGEFGMMVEDTIEVTEDGYKPITVIPRDLIVV